MHTSPRKARQAIATHATSMALSDEKDVFRCDNPRSSPPPLMTTTEFSDDIEYPPQIRSSHSAVIEKTQVAPQPLPSAPSAPSIFVDMSIPLKEEHAPVSDVAQKPRVSQFPSLAAPSPLRKSIRNPRDSSLEPSLTTTPGTGLTGNHSSWLAKVREAKAMEVTNKRASVTPSGLVAPSGGLKRKSDEFPRSLLSDNDDSEGRRAKILKTGVDTTDAATHLEPRPPGAPSLQLPAVAYAEKTTDDVTTLQTGSETDMMAPLKKAIEALRARTGKSLAGALTEINAQEPSPVDLEVVESKVINDADALPESHTLRPSLSAPVPTHGAAAAAITRTSTPPKSPRQVTGPAIAPLLREGSKRLSISDLVPKHDRSKSTSHTSPNEASISTTPPDSPPASKKTVFFVPGGPVFNKPPPVFVPPPAMKRDHSPTDRGTDVPKGHTSELPGYSLGAPFSLGLQPTKLPKSPPRGPFSARSTQSSLLSDNVFGSQVNVPAWAPHSQDTQLTSQESQPVVEEKDHPADIDDDDSWPIDDKLALTNQTWTPFEGVAPVEDSMTWSTAPSESQIGSQSPRQGLIEDATDAAIRSHQSQICVDEVDEDMDVDDDMEKDMLDEGKPTISLVTVSK